MKKFINIARLMILGICLTVGSNSIIAQPQQGRSRQDMLREHNERIQRILQEARERQQPAQQPGQAGSPPAAPGSPVNNQAQEAGQATPAPAQNQQQQPDSETTPPSADVPGQALPTGPVQNVRMTPPITQATPAPQAQAPVAARSESRMILMFNPMDSIVSMGETFRTDLLAETKEGDIDEISVLIQYPRHILSPLALDHSPLDPYVRKTIEYEFDPDAGTVYFRAKLKQPTRFAQKAIGSIVWEALEPSDGTGIGYAFGEKEKTTGLYLNGQNLLGTLPEAEDGVIRTTVQVLGPRTKPTVRQMDNGIVIGAPPRPVDDRPQEDVSISLRPSATSVNPGEKFEVAVMLNNPGEKRIDKVELYLQFDPTEVEVIDTDKGNLISRGINIHDADSRERFPFDFHRYNMADNAKGVIVYEVSASGTQVRGTGELARIHFRALKNTPRTSLVVVHNAEGESPTTAVSFRGRSMLAGVPEADKARPITGVALSIAGQTIADQELAEEDDIYNPFISNLARRMRTAR